MASAERAAAEVLEEARALSSGLHQLGKALEGHADRILRDVTAAHKRMQADLRIGGTHEEEPASRATETSSRSPEPAQTGAPPKRSNPFEEIELPAWVARER